MPETVVDIDHRGDIKLRVGEEGSESQIIFTACSRSLARSSPVFDRMLYGDFTEAKSNQTMDSQDWTVNLPNDKSAAMEVFLNISHARFNKVPPVLAVDDLYELTVLTNYYDSTRLLSPWVETWMSSIEEIATDANLLMPKMLWVSWELGRKEAFAVTAHRMLMESEGSWSTVTFQLLDIQTPPDIIERVEAIRVQTFQALLDIFRDMVENLIVVDERPRWCQHATWMGPHRCESMILGSMTFCLARAGLWPLPEARQMEYSILGLYGKLTSLIIHDIGEVVGKPSVDHRECNPGAYLLEQVKRVMDEIPNPLTDMHTRCLEERSRRLRS